MKFVVTVDIKNRNMTNRESINYIITGAVIERLVLIGVPIKDVEVVTE